MCKYCEHMWGWLRMDYGVILRFCYRCGLVQPEEGK